MVQRRLLSMPTYGRSAAGRELLASREGVRITSTCAIWGYVIVASSAMFFVTFMYVSLSVCSWIALNDVKDILSSRYLIIVAKLLPPLPSSSSTSSSSVSNNYLNSLPRFPMMDAIRRDQHYCYLIPLTIPVAFIAMYINWVSLKYFRQN